ncbi:MAG: hypothetical protein RSD57_10580 [Comamonas sp.]
MSFMHDQLLDDHNIQLLKVIADLNHEALGIEVDFSLPSHHVIRVRAQIMAWRCRPLAIRRGGRKTSASRCCTGQVAKAPH